MSESILSKSENKAGRVLKENFMEPQNLSAYKLAKELNVPVSRIQDILKGRRKISADSSVKLGRYFNVSESYFLDLQNEDRIAEAGERNEGFTGLKLSHLDVLEAEAIYIMREVAAECEKPVMLYSIGKDSSVMLHLAMKAFYPEKPPFPFLHVNTTWKFKEMIEFRDRRAKELGIEMLEYINEEGLKQGINPFDHGAAYTDIMKTQALKQALTKYGFTAAFGGGRRDEEKSRAKERIFSFRDASQAWDPKNQRPEMWKCYNTEIKKGESIRVFPISNWTESDIWQYIKRENIPIVPLYFAAERPVVERDGNLIMVDDERMRLNPGEKPMMKKVRFRTLGCYPLSGGVESDAVTIDDIIEETLSATESERTSRVIDKDGGAASMEKRKREGYF
ncbi:MAG: sulfate adenylyltransferase subunit CysD [Lachnospiraceae bacterium]|nr:sulfate adenylyltransferase subunit CysD [Lachnospiraceae bacterium]